MSTLLRDLRYATRQLRNSSGFTVAAVLTLALGVGATTAIFSVVYGLLLASLPFHDAGRLVSIGESHPQVPGSIVATYPDYQDWKTQQQSFTEIAAYSDLNPATVSLAMQGHAEQVHRVLASGNLFSLLGVSPLIGRTLNERDEKPGSDHVAVLSSGAWERYFGRDPSVVGRSVDLNEASFTIVGVLPPGAAYPADGDVWLPLSLMDSATQASRVWHSVNVLGRLRPGIGLTQARAEMQTIAAALAIAYPATNRTESVSLTPLRDQMLGTLRPTVLSLMGAVALVLLIACANVANLMLVRAAANRREVAIRQALGADRRRLFSQFLAQSSILCVLGGALGILLAGLALPLLRLALSHTADLDASLIPSIELNLPVLLFTLALCTVTATLFGLLPVMKSSPQLTEALRPGDRGSTRAYGQAALVAGEIAIAVVVLFLSTLVIRSFQRLLAVDPGFRTDHLLSLEITLPEPRYADDSPVTNRFYEQLLDRIARSGQVLSVATTTQLPLRPSQVMTRFLIEGAPPLAPGAFPLAQIRYVSPEFFRTMGIGLQQGRIFQQRDIDNQSSLFVVNEAFARRYLAGRNPLGANIVIGVLSPQPEKVPVIGVVANARDLGIDTAAQPEIYLPGFGLHGVLLVRTFGDPQAILSLVRESVRAVDPNQPIYRVQTIEAVLSDSLALRKMTASLLGIFTLVALTLAAIGIYGVLAYSVAQRTREIGVRMAVGAKREDIVRMVLLQAARYAAVGMVAGLAISLAGSRLINGLLFRTSPVDPVSISITVGALALIAALAVVIPARRAASVDPTEALRAE
ncbi:MAG TPA: ABC transporter permease [Acidobacteriaceae bacterium]|nr:ABC transporter permease [Acidobacteriaceae bacterium]